MHGIAVRLKAVMKPPNANPVIMYDQKLTLPNILEKEIGWGRRISRHVLRYVSEEDDPDQ